MDYVPVSGKEIWVGFIWPAQSAVWAYSSISSSQWLVGNSPNIGYLPLNVNKRWKCSHLLLVCVKNKSFSCLQWKKKRSRERTVCQMDTAGKCCSCPTPVWGCAKWYSLPEAGGERAQTRCSDVKRRSYGLQNKHIPFYLCAANLLITGFITKCTCA